MSNTNVMVARELSTFSHAPYMTIIEPVRKRGNPRTIARSLKNRCLNTATEPATPVVNEEVASDVKEAAESFHQSLKTVAAQEALLQV